MATTPSTKESTRRIVELLNKQELCRLDELFVTDVVTHVPSFSWVLQNRDELKAFIMDFYDAFPDVWWEIDDLFAEPETVAVRYTMRGTHDGRLAPLNLDPTGEAFEASGIQIHQFEDDRVVESWLSVDTMGLLRQLGAFPTSASYGRGSRGSVVR